jgi:EAL and modified HD-GYP domain-containing signal transduction protein
MGADKPHELIRTACTRAKFCELLGLELPIALPGSELFLLGLFSLVDTIADLPMEQIMQTLPLTDRLKDALVHRKGRLIGYLVLVETYEKGQWGFMSKVCQALKVPEEKLPAIYLQACRWSQALFAAD